MPPDQVTRRELRPSWDHYGRWFRRPDVGLLGFALVFLVGVIARSGLAIGVSAVVAGIVIGLGGATLSIRTSRVVLSERSIEHHSWFVRKKVIRLDGDLRGLLAVYAPILASKTSELLIIQQGTDGPRVRLNGAFWTHDELAEMATVAGVPITAEEFSAKDYERHAPGIMQSRDRHPILWGGALALIIVAIITASVIGYFVQEGKPPFDKQPPRSVAASTVASQDAVLEDVALAIGGRWPPIEATIGECQDDDQYKGWSRRATISGPPPATSPAVIDAIRAALAANGYEADDRIPIEGYTEVYARPEGSSFADDRSVLIALSENSATIRTSGNCEVPGRQPAK